MNSEALKLKKIVIDNDIEELKRSSELLDFAGVVVEWGMAPLHIAVMLDRKEIVKMILEREPHLVNWADWRDRERLEKLEAFDIKVPYGTPLHTAAKHCKKEMAELLLQYGADANARDFGTWTPLHHAALKLCRPVVKLLLDHGANPYAEDRMCTTPYDLVRESCAVRVLAFYGVYNASWLTVVAEYVNCLLSSNLPMSESSIDLEYLRRIAAESRRPSDARAIMRTRPLSERRNPRRCGS